MYFFSISPPGDKWLIQQKWFTEDTIKGWSKIFHLMVTNMAGVWLFCAAPVWLRDVRRWRSGLNWGAIGVPQGKWSHNQWLLCFLVPIPFRAPLLHAPPYLSASFSDCPFISCAQITSLSSNLYISGSPYLVTPTQLKSFRHRCLGLKA